MQVRGRELLTDFQRDKFRYFFYHVLDLNTDHVISKEDFIKLNKAGLVPTTCHYNYSHSVNYGKLKTTSSSIVKIECLGLFSWCSCCQQYLHRESSTTWTGLSTQYSSWRYRSAKVTTQSLQDWPKLPKYWLHGRRCTGCSWTSS